GRCPTGKSSDIVARATGRAVPHTDCHASNMQSSSHDSHTASSNLKMMTFPFRCKSQGGILSYPTIRIIQACRLVDSSIALQTGDQRPQMLSSPTMRE